MRHEHEGICYSGYRAGQSPDAGVYPSPDEVADDLRLIARRWPRIRIYDAGPHAELVLEAITREGLDLKVLMGAYVRAEASNPECPWGGVYDEATLARNRVYNDAEIARAAALCNQYEGVVDGVSIGNEATVSWTDHLVPVPRMIEHARAMRSRVSQPVTFCENHVPWVDELAELVPELDFVSIHVYPVWEYRSIDEGLEATIADYERVASRYPGVRVAITEAGWTTRSNGRGIEPDNAGAEQQARYYRELSGWARSAGVLTYLFEAFDEDWKGSPDPDEPEKHWGLFTIDRRPKLAMRPFYPELVP
jgi:exo-beta-1,3-glucanase (GH17 family)